MLSSILSYILPPQNSEYKPDFDLWSYNKNLSIQSIRKHQNELNWNILSQWVDSDVLFEFEDRVNFDYASRNPNLSVDLIYRHQDEVNWIEISRWGSLKVLESFPDRIDPYHRSWNTQY